MSDRIGALRHKIAIEQCSRTPDGLGGYTQNWTTYANAWAKIEPTSGTKRYFAGKLEIDLSHQITIRYISGIVAGMRVNYTVGASTRIFQIHMIKNIEERGIYAVLGCVEGAGS